MAIAGLRGDADDQALGALGEDARLRMAEEQAADHLARARHDRHGQVAAHRQVALGHAVVRRHLCRSADPSRRRRSGSAPRRGTSARRAAVARGCRTSRTPRAARRRACRAGSASPSSSVGVVEERAELRAAQLRGRVGHRLHERLEIELRGDRSVPVSFRISSIRVSSCERRLGRLRPVMSLHAPVISRRTVPSSE